MNIQLKWALRENRPKINCTEEIRLNEKQITGTPFVHFNWKGMKRTAAKLNRPVIQPKINRRLPIGRSEPLPKREAVAARRKFLRHFPHGFRDETYIDWERTYKWDAHLNWDEALSQAALRTLLSQRKYSEIAALAIRIESRTNLLFSFEKMALRDAVREARDARAFAIALYDLLHGVDPIEKRFSSWIDVIESLPRRQTRILTWPLVTVFGFLAQPKIHFFFKPTVMRKAALRFDVELPYASRPSWSLYKSLLTFVDRVRYDIRDLRPRDMIDMQSFLWVQGSDEYPN